MNFTIFGYPKTGKTTLFNLLTGVNIEVTSYDSGKKEPNLRTCVVPDDRLDKIWELHEDKQKKPAVIDYIDLAGISFGEIKNESYLNHLRKADGLAHVVRGFEEVRIPHIRESISPPADIQAMEEEMILADLMSVESRLEKLDKELKRDKSPEGEKEKDLLESVRLGLDKGQAVREMEFSLSEDKLLRSFAFLSRKPLFHMINVDEADIPLINEPEKIYQAEKPHTTVLAFCGKIEMEILELDEEEKQLFQEEYGMKGLSQSRFLQASYDLLDVITFFTIGKEEVKAWTVPKGISAWEAAGAIHSDIQQGFIRAEVVSWEELLKGASYRLEGKNYSVQDGDVIYFRFGK